MEKDIFEEGRKKLFKSIGTRIFFLTAAFGLIVGICAIVIGYTMYSRSVDHFYSDKAIRTAQLASSLIDKESAAVTRADVLSKYDEVASLLTDPGDEVTEIETLKLKERGWDLLEGEHKESFAKIEKQLHQLRDATDDDDYIYYMTYDEEGDWMVFIVDVLDDPEKERHDVSFFPPCTVWRVDDKVRDILTDPKKDAYKVYSSGSGMVVSKASPVYGENGEELGFIGVDIMLEDVIRTKRSFLLKYCLAIAGIVILFSFFLLWIFSRSIVQPIEKLEEGCQNFINRLGTELTEAPHYFADLRLHTGDEIEKLWLMLGDLEINVAVSMRRIKKMTTEKERVGAELSVANQIQSSMLPCTFPAFPDRSEFDLYAEMVPAKAVGGDLYDYFLIDDDHLALVIADVSGKGISAALFMVMTKQLLKSRTMREGADPVSVLTDVNAILMEDNPAHLFVTVFLGILTISNGTFIYANAGHEYPAIRKGGGQFTVNKDIHTAPVATRKKTVFKINELVLESGDTLYLYTDGIVEARNKENKMFGTERMVAALNEDPDATPKELDNRVRKRVKEFEKGEEPFDDSTSLCIKYYGSKDHTLSDSSMGRHIKVQALRENLPTVHDFVRKGIKGLSLSEKEDSILRVVAEEIFINITSYAYPESTGDVELEEVALRSENAIILTFKDKGIPFDPLEVKEPDITMDASQRKPGGLGVFYTKKKADDISYEYVDGKNVLTVKMRFGEHGHGSAHK